MLASETLGVFSVTNFMVLSKESLYSCYEVSHDRKSDLWIKVHLVDRNRCKAVLYTQA